MALTEERVFYYTKLIKDYEEFLAKPHPEKFYKEIIKFSAGFKPERTNESHILFLINDAKEQLTIG